MEVFAHTHTEICRLETVRVGWGSCTCCPSIAARKTRQWPRWEDLARCHPVHVRDGICGRQFHLRGHHMESGQRRPPIGICGPTAVIRSDRMPVVMWIKFE